MSRFHELQMQSISGENVDFSEYQGTLSLVVNVASRCGLTPQYAGLRTLHEENKARGFQVLAFPCNQFGAQEPGTNEEILEFARSKYGASFPMFARIEVNGDGAAELYRYLKGDGDDIAWNFTKFLVGRDGEVLARFEPPVTPEEIGEALREHL